MLSSRFPIIVLPALVAIAAGPSSHAQTPKAGAGVAQLEADDSLVIGGGILPYHATGQEGELRASAVVIEAVDGTRACLVACDVLMIDRDILDVSAREIEQKT